MDNNNDKQENSMEDKDSKQEDSSLVESNETEDETTNNWVKEISDNSEEQLDDITENLVNLPVNKGDLPDWINTISPEDPENLEPVGKPQENQDIPKHIHFDSKHDSWDTEQSMDEDRIDEQDHKQEDSGNNNEHLDEGFVEISGYDLDEEDEKISEPTSSEVSNEQEELPDWLEDMIIEPPEMTPDTNGNINEEPIFSNDEPTRPVKIVEDIVLEMRDEQSLEEVSLAPILELDEIDQEVSEPKIEEEINHKEFEEETIEDEPMKIEDMPAIPAQGLIELVDEVETTSLAEEIHDHEELQVEEEEWQLNDQRQEELPKTLNFAKQLLDQGEIKAAYDILQTFIKNQDHLVEIKTWISEMIGVEETSDSMLWEILGDIALMDDEPSEALSSYERALSILLNNKQGV